MRRFAQVWTDDEFVQQVAAQLPWFHNCVLLDKVADDNERIWYARAAIHHGWSRAILVHQIESGLHRRQGKAITNFDRALPPPQSDLAQEVTKDPYNFDFLMLGEEAHERDLERGKPIGISEYRLAESLPDRLRGSLPTVEELESELGSAGTEED
jgi:predicted nuclease of restriction endonuclease-like (RecB) superfamily